MLLQFCGVDAMSAALVLHHTARVREQTRAESARGPLRPKHLESHRTAASKRAVDLERTYS